MTRHPRPTLAATDSHTCLKCGRPIHKSKEWFVGDDCAGKLGPDRVEALRLYAEQQVDPFTIPAGQRPPSPQARLNHHNARAAADPGQLQLCRHENQAGRCGSCRDEAKPKNASKRIIRVICAQPLDQRRAERTAVVAARAPAPPRRAPPAATPTPARPIQTALI
ncbi:hypothetical protein [Actinomadura sp. 3N508]|uniref:hypothetical protein n=1 Tax=Actinomadura sp. 3N508 TaxID=3375153 RepID=UPI0037A3837C